MSISRLIYSILLYLLTPIVLLRLLLKSIKAPRYRQRIGERFGLIKDISSNQLIWIHAVSVGEFIAATPLIKRIRSEFPDYKILITTTTPTGSERVQATFADEVEHCYLPYDLPSAVNLFLRRVKPSLALIMETEIWPNLYSQVKRRSIPLLIANARLSEKSFNGYQKLSGLVGEALANVDVVCARDKLDVERFKALASNHVEITAVGNIKFDVNLDSKQKDQGFKFKKQFLGAGRRVLVAASTHAGEEEVVLDAFVKILDKFPDLLLLIVPRHPERFMDVAELCEKSGFSVVTRSGGQKVTEDTSIYIGNSMGEMMLYFSTADIAYIGGSLVPVGGHNMLEAMVLGVPCISGPHVHNFQDIAEQMVQRGAGFIVNDQIELANKVTEILASNTISDEVAANALDFIDDNRGAIDKIMNKINGLIH